MTNSAGTATSQDTPLRLWPGNESDVTTPMDSQERRGVDGLWCPQLASSDFGAGKAQATGFVGACPQASLRIRSTSLASKGCANMS